MPNWCNNSVSITETKEGGLLRFVNAYFTNDTITKLDSSQEILFRETIKKKGLMSSLLPCLDEEGWHDFNVANWGTKWDVRDCYVSFYGCEIYLDYDTAWSPNLEFWQMITEEFDIEVSMTSNEPGYGIHCNYFISEGSYSESELSYYVIDEEKEYIYEGKKLKSEYSCSIYEGDYATFIDKNNNEVIVEFEELDKIKGIEFVEGY